MSAKSRERREQFLKDLAWKRSVGKARFVDVLRTFTEDEKLASILGNCPVIVADNVQQYIDNLPDNASILPHPIAMLPFEQMFVEMTSYENGVICQQGYLCEAWGCESGFSRLRSMPSASSFVTITRFIRLGDKVVEVGRYALLPLNELGEVVNYDNTIWSIPFDTSAPTNQWDVDNISQLGGLLYTLTLLNCHNIELTDCSPDPIDSIAYEKHFGIPLTKYKNLTIKSMSKRAGSDQPQQQFDVMPLHLRRGNFAHYTDDAPLFGKFTGTFWRPATVVGSEKNGVVVKDYKVLAPEA